MGEELLRYAYGYSWTHPSGEEQTYYIEANSQVDADRIFDKRFKLDPVKTRITKTRRRA